jgi:hypothetical protein
MEKDEPPSPCFTHPMPMLVGRNSRGQWVVRSEDGLYGGLFVNRTEAVRYALFENGHHADAIIIVGGTLELTADDRVDVDTPAAAMTMVDRREQQRRA